MGGLRRVGDLRARDIDPSRFWPRVRRIRGSDCWFWIGAKARGYGILRLRSRRLAQAHRVAYALRHGACPSALLVRHECDTPACVNPAHLLLGSQKDNMLDARERHRLLTGARHPRAKLSDEQIVEIRLLAHLPRKIVAERFGISVRYVGRVLSGARRVS